MREDCARTRVPPQVLARAGNVTNATNETNETNETEETTAPPTVAVLTKRSKL